MPHYSRIQLTQQDKIGGFCLKESLDTNNSVTCHICKKSYFCHKECMYKNSSSRKFDLYDFQNKPFLCSGSETACPKYGNFHKLSERFNLYCFGGSTHKSHWFYTSRKCFQYVRKKEIQTSLTVKNCNQKICKQERSQKVDEIFLSNIFQSFIIF